MAKHDDIHLVHGIVHSNRRILGMCPVAPLSDSHKLIYEVWSRSPHTVPNVPLNDRPDVIDKLRTCLDTDSTTVWQFQILRPTEVWFHPHIVNFLELLDDGGMQGARDEFVVLLVSICVKDEVLMFLYVGGGDLIPDAQQQWAWSRSLSASSPN